MTVRRLTWPVACALVVLAARAFAYALSSQRELALQLQHSAGGPRLVVLAVSVPLAGVAVAATVACIASIAVRERHVVVGGPPPAPIQIARLAVSAVGLFAASSAAFALFESYLHWRAGLGFHGWHCLVGPVHRDALPFLAAFSLIASAAVEAIRHLCAWVRRTLAELAVGTSPFAAAALRRAITVLSLAARSCSAWNARGPPRAARPC